MPPPIFAEGIIAGKQVDGLFVIQVLISKHILFHKIVTRENQLFWMAIMARDLNLILLL